MWPQLSDKCECGHAFAVHDERIGGDETWACLVAWPKCDCHEFKAVVSSEAPRA